MSNVKNFLLVVIFGLASGAAIANPPPTEPRVDEHATKLVPVFIKK